MGDDGFTYSKFNQQHATSCKCIQLDAEMTDLVTPNRLLLGRNNERSPTGILSVKGDSDKLIRDNRRIFEAWFDYWITSHVPNLVARPKWFSSDVNLKVGDVVLFYSKIRNYVLHVSMAW